MKASLRNVSFSTALLAGLFAGIIAAIINVIFDMIYRSAADIQNFKIVNPLAIFIISPLFLTIAGIIFYEFCHVFKRGELIFIILFIILTLIEISGLGFRMTGYKGLIGGIALITGLIAAFLVPYLSEHPGIYKEMDIDQ